MNPDSTTTQPLAQPIMPTPMAPSVSQDPKAQQFQSMLNYMKTNPNNPLSYSIMNKIKGGQMNDYLQAAGYDPSKYVTPPPQTTTPSQQSNESSNPIIKAGRDISTETQGHAANIVQDLSEKPSFSGALDVAGNVAGEVGNFFGTGLSLLAQATTPKPILDAVTGELSKAVQAVVGTPQAKALQGQWNKFQAQNPEQAKNVGNYINIAALMGGDEAAPGQITKQDVTQGIKTGVEGVKNTASDVVQGAKDSAGQHYIDSAKEAWAKPTTVSKASYGKATDIFNNAASNGHDISDTLVKNGVKLSDNVEGGQFSTDSTADKIRSDAGKMSNETLRPALEIANKTVPKTPVKDIIDKTIADIKNSTGVTPGDKLTQIAKAKAEGDALTAEHPDGMSLSDMHDKKITYASNGKYSPIGDVNVNNSAAVNRSFGRTLADQVESKSPSGIPVHEFNSELQKQYQVADYLDALNNKKVPTSLVSKITNTAGKVAGASVGASLGGGVLGGVGGYHIGGMVESMLENMPNPIKNYFLKNMETTNPEAFTKIQEYLKSSK